MNLSLYKQMLRTNMKGIMSYGVGSAFYILLILGIYPSIAGNAEDIEKMIKSMPEGFLNAFGFENGLGNLEDFISGEYYGLIFIVILSIFSVMLSTKLLAKRVDQGSMAYILSAPTTRGKVAFTQAAVLTTGLLIIMAVTTAAGLAGYHLMLGGDYDFNVSRFLVLNLLGFLLFFAVGGISFLFSAISNDEKRALGLSGGITFLFFSFDLLGKLSEKTEWLRSLSVFSLFRPDDIVNGSTDIAQVSLVLAAVGFAAFALSILIFKKRDLPL
ncbi:MULTISPECIES: ABC transporter permease subunit [Bacillus]|jgi:ABC-2 type transport system permease protein|uniref:ABC transporter permease subunit n=1 Tax=Bacillus TaxID=1386 RepID=UPI000303408E|nr:MULTISPECIES: ABC transporter permease subunit [Bacillus]KUL18601.1 permease [Bacillus licheniformis LMG 6934]ARC66967.1 ABC-2 transporter protein [Bacillus licheniformis]KAA0809920.1 permease [Bacillus licheniformis]KAA0820451.1 permease [Bacillus licheniformis]KAA0842049.1 permease [Bacillus licheniformis]